MNSNQYVQYFILGLPYVMLGTFAFGFFFRTMIWYTVKRHDWFAHEFEKRVNRYLETQIPGEGQNQSFYIISKRLLERAYYETFAMRDRLKRRKGDTVMGMSDRIFLIKPGAAWMVKDLLKQLKFLKWSKETPKLQQITKSTFEQNPCFNRVFGVVPVGAMNDFVSMLPGLFVVAGILGTFVGIAGGLSELGGMNLSDLDNTKNIMDRFLHEISFAMKTSIAGIIFSLLGHVTNVIFSPDRVFVGMIDRFENTLDLLWYRCDNNAFPSGERAFDEHRDPIEAMAEDAINAEITKSGFDKARESVREATPSVPPAAKAS